jgi:hypothetical protein
MKARPATEAEKLIDKNDIIGNSDVDRLRQVNRLFENADWTGLDSI